MAQQVARSGWVQVSRRRPGARLRLICLPPAGGGASTYRDWPGQLPDEVEVVSAQLPGRESRFTESPIASMEQLAGPLLAGLDDYLERPFALFGHSMGALIAFELARRLRLGGVQPVHLFASGCRAPHLPSRSHWHTLPDGQFLTALQELGGIPPELLAEPEFLAAMLPTLRSDCTLSETYQSSARALLSCPVSAFGGLRDKDVPPEDVQAWSHHTTGPFQIHLLPGDHFFLHSARPELLQLVVSKLQH
ncbi:MAG: thioesterase II family protein [Pseudonocardiaceae bacterium]